MAIAIGLVVLMLVFFVSNFANEEDSKNEEENFNDETDNENHVENQDDSC